MMVEDALVGRESVSVLLDLGGGAAESEWRQSSLVVGEAGHP